MSLRAPKSIPSISPRALCRRSQRVARSESARPCARQCRQGAAALAAVETETVEQCRQAETGQRLEPGMLDTDRAPVAVAGGIDINTLPVPLRAFPAAVFPAANQQGGDSAGLGLDPRIGIGEAEGGLSGEMIRDASAQVRPVPAPDCKMAPEIEKGALTDPVPLAAVLDQAEGDVVAAVAGGAGLGLSNEHAAAMAKGIPRRKALLKNMALQTIPETSNHNKSMSCESNTVKSTSNPTQKC